MSSVMMGSRPTLSVSWSSGMERSFARRSTSVTPSSPGLGAPNGLNRSISRQADGIVTGGIARTPSALLQRLEVAEQRRHIFSHRRMDMHGPRDHGIGRPGIHHVEEGMHHLVAADAENSHAEDFPALGIHQHFHEALRLAALARATDRAHWIGGDQRLAAGLAHLGLGH